MSFVSLRPLPLVLSALCLLFSSALVEACAECEEKGMIGVIPFAITSTVPCHDCHHQQTSPPNSPVITVTSHKCASRTVTPYTSGTSTFWVSSSSCPVPQSPICPAPVQASATTVFRNITQPPLLSTILRYVNVTIPITYTSYATGSPPATVTLPASTAIRETSYPVLSTVIGTATQLTTGKLCTEPCCWLQS